MEIRREPIFEADMRKSAPTLSEFAIQSQISEDKVWELIEEGQVSARFVNESILIMQDQPAVDRVQGFDSLPKAPHLALESAALPEISAKTFAKEESYPNDLSENNSDILVFAQDALSRHAELSKEMLATKDELMRLKDEKILFLSDLLGLKEKEIKRLNRSLEELATLKKFDI